MTDHRPYCVKCKCRMFPKKNGVTLQYTKDTYQRGDLWECPECGHQIVVGFGCSMIMRDGVIINV